MLESGDVTGEKDACGSKFMTNGLFGQYCSLFELGVRTLSVRAERVKKHTHEEHVRCGRRCCGRCLVHLGAE